MADVDFFEAKLNRLKTVLHVSKDKEAGEALGLKEKAFNARKTRGSFPEKELRALAQQRPDLGIDVDYVLTGVTEAEALRQRDALHAAGGIPEAKREANRAEVELLSNFRACPPDVREALRKVLSYLAGSSPAAVAPKATGTSQVATGDGNIQIGSAGGGVRIKNR